MDAIKSAILSVGLTFGPGVVKDVVNHLNNQDTINFSSYKNRADIATRDQKLDAALSDYEASRMTTHGPPSHHGAQRDEIARATAAASRKLDQFNISSEEAREAVAKYLKTPQMYSGDATQASADEAWRNK